mmetsp:Transcript_31334/g.72712  ORF Transcript_31334/g.72712 Transcript_31334/m.72712 type:complete len:261 (+) Transcript_31334:1045-1827(+)
MWSNAAQLRPRLPSRWWSALPSCSIADTDYLLDCVPSISLVKTGPKLARTVQSELTNSRCRPQRSRGCLATLFHEVQTHECSWRGFLAQAVTLWLCTSFLAAPYAATLQSAVCRPAMPPTGGRHITVAGVDLALWFQGRWARHSAVVLPNLLPAVTVSRRTSGIGQLFEEEVRCQGAATNADFQASVKDHRPSAHCAIGTVGLEMTDWLFDDLLSEGHPELLCIANWQDLAAVDLDHRGHGVGRAMPAGWDPSMKELRWA